MREHNGIPQSAWPLPQRPTRVVVARARLRWQRENVITAWCMPGMQNIQVRWHAFEREVSTKETNTRCTAKTEAELQPDSLALP